MSDAAPNTPNRPAFWRSTRLGAVAAGFFLIVGIPLFIRMPLWCDVTLYQTAVQAMSTGGTHYRDVFDTNPPGFPLALRGVQAIVGSSSDAIRIVDLLVFATILILQCKLARFAGAQRSDQVWMVAGGASFYLFISEYCHLQRDFWMMVPALAATLIRIRRINRLVEGERGLSTSIFGSLIAEGAIWALGCWIKPHVVLPAVMIWLLTSATLWKRCQKPIRLIFGDAVGIITGVIPVFALAIGWLIMSGAWDAYLDVNRTWNSDYLLLIKKEILDRLVLELFFFPPWSPLLLVAVPLSIVNFVRPFFRPWDGERFARMVLAGLFFSWVMTAMLVQRHFDYTHVPEVLLMMMLFAANRWIVTMFVILVQLILAVLLITLGIPMTWSNMRMDEMYGYRPINYFINAHAALKPQRTRYWLACITDPSRETRRGVAMVWDRFGGIDPVELGAVADYLKTQNLNDHELIAWHDTPHALYTMLKIKPGIRFMHITTMQTICQWNAESPNYKRLRDEVAAAIPKARFVVSDMHRVVDHEQGVPLESDASGLPVSIPDWQRGQFPLNLPVVFRSPEGRYLVHRIDHPFTLGECKLPELVGHPIPW